MQNATAIVGMACRVPGAASTAEFWRLMLEGVDPVRPIGAGRWRGRLHGVELFDSEFFGISPREADGVDPQQRMLLEVTHEALQDAGIPAAALAGTDAGVFVGQHTNDYAQLQSEAGTVDPVYAVTGSAARGITSGRVSFALDLRGPSLTIDAACSSSLAALHLAVASLRTGESRVAVVGAVNLMLVATMDDALAAAGVATADGRCKFGDARADGFVRSEGIAAVLLKPLADAVADGDRVRAVILGSAVNNDGRSSGHRVKPGVDGQEQVLRAAYRDAGVDPADVDYVEAHGTGTPTGDPVELTALSRVLGAGRPADRPCIVGSAKSTVGHTEAAAGLVGLIRATLCLEHALVPPNAHLGELTPAFPWPGSGLELSRPAAPLAARARAHLVGVSSFGFSGTNAHVVLSGPERAAVVTRPVAIPEGPSLLTISARSQEALHTLTSAYRRHLALEGRGRRDAWTDIARTAAGRRDHHRFRLALTAESHDDAVAVLDDVLGGRPTRRAVRGGPVETRPPVVFVFPGQGSQWVGMGRELLAGEREFARTLLRCDEAVRAEAGWSVLEHLTAATAEPRRDEVDVVQPVLWAVQVALAALWRSWGVEPDLMIGHSMGEVAAAHVAGALSLPDAAAVICRRSRLARGRRGRGGMVLAELSEEASTALLAAEDGEVVVAACNGPTETVLSGATDALVRVTERLRHEGVFVRWISADFASHSPQMDAVGGDLRCALRTVSPVAGTVPIHSTVLDEVVDGRGMDADYWFANLRRPVRFLPAVRAHTDGLFVEISPHPVLSGAIADTVGTSTGPRVVAVGSLRRGAPERASMLSSLGELYAAGVSVSGAAAAGPGPGRVVDLPAYPWQHTVHWFSAAGSAVVPAARPALPSAPAATVPGPRQADSTAHDTAGVIRACCATVVGLPAEQLPLDRPLDRVGLDSIMAAELRGEIRRTTGVRLSLGQLLGGASAADLAVAVQAGLDGPAAPSRAFGPDVIPVLRTT